MGKNFEQLNNEHIPQYMPPELGSTIAICDFDHIAA